MKTKAIFPILVFLLIAVSLSAQNPPVAPAQDKPVILEGGTIHTGTGEVIQGGLIAFSGGRITWVGKAPAASLDRKGYEVIDVTGKEIYPGLIMPITGIGLSEIGSGVDVADDSRETGDLNPDVRSIVAYNTDSHVIPVIRSNGILLAQIVPGGTLMPGMSSVVQLDAWNWKDAAYRMDNGIMLGWPRKSSQAGRMAAPVSADRAGAGAYEKNVALIEKIFTDAIAYNEVTRPVDFNLRMDAMRGLFDGTKTLFISAQEAKGMIEAVMMAKRYGVKRIVIAGADALAWELKEFIKENNLPVIIASPLSLPKYDYSDIREPFRLASKLTKEGILVAISYSQQAYGNLPFAAGETAAYGLTREEALQTVTLNTAKILGIDDLTGSLEAGKDANIVVSSGDLLDMRTNNVELAFITGRKIDLDNKHKQLYRRFQVKYQSEQ